MNKKVIIFGALAVAAAAGGAYWYLGRNTASAPPSTPQTPIQIIASGVQNGTGFYVGTEFIPAVEFADLMTRFGRTFEEQAAIYIGRGGIQAASVAGLGNIMLVS